MPRERSERLLRDVEAAERLGVKVQTLRNWRMMGTGVPYVRIGDRSVRYSEDDLKAYINARKVNPSRRAGK